MYSEISAQPPRFKWEVLELMAMKIRAVGGINAVVVFETSPADLESAIFLLVVEQMELCNDFAEVVSMTAKESKYRPLTSSGLRYQALCSIQTEFADMMKAGHPPGDALEPYVDVLVVTPDWVREAKRFEDLYHSSRPGFIARLTEKEPLLVL